MCVSQAAGVILGGLCPLVRGRRDPGATRGAGSAPADPGSGARAAATATPDTGGLERRAVDPAPALTAVIQSQGSVWTG